MPCPDISVLQQLQPSAKPHLPFVQAWLFGTHHPKATLHNVSWELSRTGLIILDDMFTVWRQCDRPLLLLISKAPALSEFPALDGFHYLANLLDTNLGGECAQAEDGSIIPDAHSQLAQASRRLQMIVEYSRSAYAPDDLAILLQLSVIEWTRLAEVKRRAELDCEHLSSQLQSSKAQVQKLNAANAALEADLRQVKRMRSTQTVNVGVTTAT
jgi:hypothetical protein